MATTEDFRVANGGSVLHLTFKKGSQVFSVEGADVKIIIKKKDGTTVVKDAEWETSGSGTDGKIKYVFTTQDLDQDGQWQAQGFARWTDDFQIYSSIITFKVGANLDEIPLDNPLPP